MTVGVLTGTSNCRYADEALERLYRAAADPRSMTGGGRERMMVRPRGASADARADRDIGGGVGGARDRLPHRGARRAARILSRRKRWDQWSTFQLGGLVWQLRSSSRPDAADDGTRSRCTASSNCSWVAMRRRSAWRAARARAGGPPQVAWAKEFGLRSSSCPQSRRDLFSAGSPTVCDVPPHADCSNVVTSFQTGYLDPVADQHTARTTAARARRLPGLHAQRRDAIDVVGGRVRGLPTEWGARRGQRSVINAGACSAAELGGWPGVRVPVVTFAHEYW